MKLQMNGKGRVKERKFPQLYFFWGKGMQSPSLFFKMPAFMRGNSLLKDNDQPKVSIKYK